MKAELVAVGTELLEFGRSDTNSDWLARRLQELGIGVAARVQVGDDPERIASVVRGALERSGLVVACGGLGPTGDDRTREGVALALGLPLERDGRRVRRLEGLFRTRGLPFDERHARQAELPRGAAWIENPVGSAPGFRLERAGRLLFVLPGVPAEMKAMFEGGVAPLIAARPGLRGTTAQKVLKVAGRTESWVDERIRELYGAPGAIVTILTRATGIEVLLRVAGPTPEESRARAEALAREIAGRLGTDLYGEDDDTLESVVGMLLREEGRTLATAESCTAGLLAAAITSVPGASAWYRGGVVVYADDLKTDLAEVSAETLRLHGAVSSETAVDLARGVRRRCGADLGIGVTGIAGPAGGTPEKPVGLVHVAVADQGGAIERRRLLPGDREAVRGRTVTMALDLLRRRLRGWL